MGSVRRDTISSINIVCVLAMLVFHCFSGVETIFREAWQGTIYEILTVMFSFVFDAFIFLSGLRLFFNRYDKMKWDTFYVNRLIIVILPYLIFSAIYYAIFYFTGNNLNTEDGLFTFLIEGEFMPQAYFIVVLAQLYLLMPVFKGLLKKVNHIVLMIFAVLLSIIFGAAENKYGLLIKLFLPYLAFFVCGALAAVYYKELKDFVRKRKWAVLVAFFLMLIIYEVCALKEFGYAFGAVRILYSLSAVLLLFTIGTLVADARYIESFVLQQIDKSSYFIFLIHGLVIYSTDIIICDRIGMESGAGVYAIRGVCAILATVLISIAWRYIRNVFLLKLDR